MSSSPDSRSASLRWLVLPLALLALALAFGGIRSMTSAGDDPGLGQALVDAQSGPATPPPGSGNVGEPGGQATGGPTGGPTQEPSVGLFKCYYAKVMHGTPRFERLVLVLLDQFEEKKTRVEPPELLCTSVSKDENGKLTNAAGIPNGSLTCYRINDAPGEPAFERPTVFIEDQFGAITVDMRRARTLCVPASKASQTDAAGAVSPTGSYKCYDVRVTPDTERFERRIVMLVDQFEAKQTQVVRPRRLCVPVMKEAQKITLGGFQLGDARLCYQIRDGDGEPRFEEVELDTLDQFGERRLEISKARLLCVPADKSVVEVGEPELNTAIGSFLDRLAAVYGR